MYVCIYVCYVMLCYGMLCYVMLWYVMLWYVMLCYVMYACVYIYIYMVVFFETRNILHSPLLCHALSRVRSSTFIGCLQYPVSLHMFFDHPKLLHCIGPEVHGQRAPCVCWRCHCLNLKQHNMIDKLKSWKRWGRSVPTVASQKIC